MNLLFAAGDVGGARALLPVARAAMAAGHNVAALAHGAFHREGAADWCWLEAEAARQQKADAMLYATSVADWAAFEVAEAARARGIPLLHVLDNWSTYAGRLHGRDGRSLVPETYAVMDDLAHQEAVADGVPEAILAVTGHPNLDDLVQEAAKFAKSGRTEQRLLFVSEPARADSGPAEDPGARGYDEVGVSEALMAALASMAPEGLEIHVAAHPREDREEVANRWAGLTAAYPGPKGPLDWVLVPPDGVRAALHGASHVAGMSSILLYEAWLLGLPVASLQPGLRGQGLRTLAKRDGLLFCDAADDLPGTIARLLGALPAGAGAALSQHANAAQRVLKLAQDLVDRNADA